MALNTAAHKATGRETTPRSKSQMPTAQEYGSVLSTFGDVVQDCAESGEGAIILIRPAKKKKRWIIQTSSLCFLQHPDKVVVDELEKLLASPKEWTDWEDTLG